MNVHNFHQAFERMRLDNLGKHFERRELGLLALKYGIYFNSTMWASGLGALFTKAKVGPKFVYIFKNVPTQVGAVETLSRNIFAYKHDTNRTIEHAKSILRRFGIQNVN